ncbi:MAG: hypothetical protein M3R15_09415, partial [Acidobacteriota bacterium]|nr:hypothetical protein [Acidobacteriota bacterium]
MSSYYGSWREDIYTCSTCSWKGTGEQCKHGEVFSGLYEICCPSCSNKVGLVMHPTIEESRQNWDKLSKEAKKQVESIEKFQEDFT